MEMTYDQWLNSVPVEMKGDSLWKMELLDNPPIL